VILHKTALKGVYLISPQPRRDERGYFARVFCERELSSLAPDLRIVQINVAWNEKKGTLRGLHLQTPPHEEIKLVSCTRGAVLDVAVDVRRSSPTFGQSVCAKLTWENGNMLYIPKGFAHGYQTLADDTSVQYFVSAFYAPGSEKGYRYDDPAFAIAWPDPDTPTVSEKDRAWPYLNRLEES
jgi:dTDP-4-dehydrorhamnose 3,5-epimerase